MKRNRLLKIVMSTLGLLPVAAAAHPQYVEVSGWLDGIAHPFSGMGHVLAMLAVGIWAAQQGGRAIYTLPVAFVLCMTAGSQLTLLAIDSAYVEYGIGSSLLVVGVLIVAAAKLSLPISALVIGAFAVFHGYEHGLGMPADLRGGVFVPGFICATLLLHVIGIGLGKGLLRFGPDSLLRGLGGILALGGMGLLLTV